jgi:hemerythrin
MNQVLTKVCFKCNSQKEFKDFYKHPKTKDGYLGKCKICTKLDSKIISQKLVSTTEGLEKERQRHREKYIRLNYKEKQKVWNEKRPYSKSCLYKNLSKKLKTEKGIELHHWNYSEKYIEDVFFLKIKEHRQAHKYLIKTEKNIFSDLNGNLLDTREKHLNYLISKGIKF